MKNVFALTSIFLLCSCGTEYQFSESGLAKRDSEDQELVAHTEPSESPVPSENEVEPEPQSQPPLDELDIESELEPDPISPVEPVLQVIDQVDSEIRGSNLLINGDFSYPEIHQFWDLFHNTEIDSELFGWTFSFTDESACGEDFSTSEDGSWIEIQNHSGDQLVELDSHCKNGVSKSEMKANLQVSQEVELTDGVYEISFDHKARNSPTGMMNSLKVSANELEWDIESSGQWQTTTILIEVGSLESLKLTLEDTGFADTYGMLIDNISVRLVL